MESNPFPPTVFQNRRLVNPGRILTRSQCATHTLLCNGSFEPSQKALLQCVKLSFCRGVQDLNLRPFD